MTSLFTSFDKLRHYRVPCNTASLKSEVVLVYCHFRLCYTYHSKHSITFHGFSQDHADTRGRPSPALARL